MNINEASIQNEMLTIANEHKMTGTGKQHIACFLILCQQLKLTKLEDQLGAADFYPKNSSAFRQKLEALRSPMTPSVSMTSFLSPGDGKISHANIA